MDPFETNFHTKSREVRLLASEKAMLRARVLGAPEPIASPFQALFLVPALRGVAIAMGLVIMVSGPLAYGAQQSLPGDPLYGLEVDIVEKIEASLRFTPEAKQEYHAERLAERLSELRTVEGRHIVLTPEASITVIEDVAEHAEAASRDSADPAPARTLPQLIRTAALLSAHEEVLDDLGVAEGRIADLTETLEDRIDTRTEEYLTTEEASEIAADIAEKLDRADDVLPTITSTHDAEALAERFEDIRGAVEEGDLNDAFEDTTELEIELLTEEYLRELPED